MNCTKARRLILRCVDGELSPRLADKVKAHLSACSQCRLQYEETRRLSELLAEWEPMTPRLGYEALCQRIRQRQDIRSTFGLPVPQWAAVALSLLSVGVGLAAGVRSDREVQFRAASVEQVASLIGFSHHDDLVEAAIVAGFQDVMSGRSEAER